MGKWCPCLATATFTQNSYRLVHGLNSVLLQSHPLGPLWQGLSQSFCCQGLGDWGWTDYEGTQKILTFYSFGPIWSHDGKILPKQPAALVLTLWRLLQRNTSDRCSRVKCSILIMHRALNLWSKPRAHSPKETSPKRRQGTSKWKVGPMTQPLWGQKQAEAALAWLKRIAKLWLVLPLGWIKAGLRTTADFKLTCHPCAQHSIHVDRRQPKWSAAESCWCGLSHYARQGMPPSCCWPNEGTLNKWWLCASVSPSVMQWTQRCPHKSGLITSLPSHRFPALVFLSWNWCFHGVYGHLSQKILIHTGIMHAGFWGMNPGEPQKSLEKSSNSST